MLKTQLLHPQILEALGRAGHGSKVLICDGNYPASTTLGPRARLVNLNLCPGLVNCVQVLETLISVIPIEAASVMQYPRDATSSAYALDHDPPIWDEFRELLKPNWDADHLDCIERFKFYQIAGGDDVALTIATGEERIYANILLTIGVVRAN